MSERLKTMQEGLEKQRWAAEWLDSYDAPSRRRVKLRWHDGIRTVLLVKKWRDKEVSTLAKRVAEYLLEEGCRVGVEASEEYGTKNGIFVYNKERDKVDVVISIGGDGTFLHAGRLFTRGAHPPPCVIFGMGSLGFLANFDANKWKSTLQRLLKGEEIYATMRTRLRCEVNGSARHVLNEVAVLCRSHERMGKVKLDVDGQSITLVEGDGLIVSTPTGSTGYSMSCGGPIVSPSVPATIVTPIAPSSLSFRPIIVSESSVICIETLSNMTEVLHDGRLHATLPKHSFITIKTSLFPMMVVHELPYDQDWFRGINSKLKWNARGAEQKEYPPPRL